MEKQDPKGFLDKVRARIVSRKLLVWGTATIALFMEIVPAEQWIEVSVIYLGGQAVVDSVSSYVSAKFGS
jgi:hypothetical protein